MSRLASKLLLLLAFGSAHADSLMIGADYWNVNDAQVRYLPNYSLPDDTQWQPVSSFARGTIRRDIETDFSPLTLTFQGQYSTLIGGRVDRLDADIHLTDTLGVRVGVLPYRTAWCRQYSMSNPWIAEPDAFCRFHGLNEMAQGAFGAQVYKSSFVGGFWVDSMAGIYRPEVDGQDKGLGPYVKVGPNTSHKKFGASLNVMHMASGIQARASYLKTLQNQASDTGGYERQLDYDTIYLAVEGNATKKLTIRGSISAYIGDQNNPRNPFGWNGQSKTLEAIYKPLQGHTIALGYSVYENVTTYSKAPNFQRLEVPSYSIAWRKDWKSSYSVVQYTQTYDDATTRAGVLTSREGQAIGIRIGKNF